VRIKIILLFIDVVHILALYNFVLNVYLPLHLKTVTVMMQNLQK